MSKFQSTLPRGERPGFHLASQQHRKDFNPRSREGSDLQGFWRFLHVKHFNPRSREGSDMLIFPWTFYDHDFNPRSRAGSDGRCLASQQHCKNFNPRSRAGSDPVEGYIFRFDLISIHAPARGATFCRGLYFPDIYISIHAPARGATSKLVLLKDFFNDFNPRSRAGSDRMQ